MAGEEIHIYQGRGELIGGRTICGKKLIAKRIGSIAEPPTVIYVGILPEVLNELNTINLEIEKNKKLLDEILKNQKFIESHPEKLENEKKQKFLPKVGFSKREIRTKTREFKQPKRVTIIVE